jgi:curved DNA-binding protein CbpA
MTTHYETLGIEKDASQDQIKKAYRKKARENHSDRGGDDETMSEINVAYETLSDPERRGNYDKTGQSRLDDVDMQAFNIVISKCMQWIQQGAVGNMFEEVKASLEQDKLNILGNEARGNQLVKHLTDTANKIKHKGAGPNRIKDAVDTQAAHVRQQLENIANELRRISAAIDFINTYEYIDDSSVVASTIRRVFIPTLGGLRFNV